MMSWVTGLVDRGGYSGLAFLMLAENVFPPIPSEVIMPLAGYGAASGKTWLAAAILFGTIGSLAGAFFWYVVGRSFGEVRMQRMTAAHGRWLGMNSRDFGRATGWFRKRGFWAVLVGRCLPGIRSAISIPAGVTHMPLASFALASVIGITVWNSGLAVIGYILAERYREAGQVIGPMGAVLMIGIIALYLYRVIAFRPEPGEKGKIEAAPLARPDVYRAVDDETP